MPTRPSHDWSVATSLPLSPCRSTRQNGEPSAASAGLLRAEPPIGARTGSAKPAISRAPSGMPRLTFLPEPGIFRTRAFLPQRGLSLGLWPTGLADGLALAGRALPADHHGIRPKTCLGSPFSGNGGAGDSARALNTIRARNVAAGRSATVLAARATPGWAGVSAWARPEPSARGRPGRAGLSPPAGARDSAAARRRESPPRGPRRRRTAGRSGGFRDRRRSRRAARRAGTCQPG